MAGQPKKRAIVVELTRRAREEIGENAAPIEYVERWIASGKTMRALAQDLAGTLSIDILADTLSWIIRGTADDATARLVIARARGAGVLADEALEIADSSAGGTREDIASAKLRADVRHWTAGKWNRDEYGESKQAALTINVNTLHLDALRAPLSTIGQEIHNPMQLRPPTAHLVETVVVAEVEDEQLTFDMSPRMPGEGLSRGPDLK